MKSNGQQCQPRQTGESAPALPGQATALSEPSQEKNASDHSDADALDSCRTDVTIGQNRAHSGAGIALRTVVNATAQDAILTERIVTSQTQQKKTTTARS